MFVHEAMVIGGEGGAPYSHEDSLKEAGHCLGCGANGMRLSKLHVERWQVLSHHTATYTSVADPSRTITVKAQGNIRGKGHHNSADFEIPPDHRVVQVTVVAGERFYSAGARCLNYIQLNTRHVEAESRWHSTGVGEFQETHTPWQADIYSHTQHGEFKMLHIPHGLTLAGIAGRAGDSWDQVSVLLCPWLPEGGVWSPSIHRHLITPFRQQVRALLLCLHQLQRSAAISELDKGVSECLVAALFKVTFLSGSLPKTSQPPAAASNSASTAAAAAAAASSPAPDASAAAASNSAAASNPPTGASNSGAAASDPAAAHAASASAAADDFVAAFVRQQVLEAGRECEVAEYACEVY